MIRLFVYDTLKTVHSGGIGKVPSGQAFTLFVYADAYHSRKTASYEDQRFFCSGYLQLGERHRF